MGNHHSKANEYIELESLREASPYIKALEIAVRSTIKDTERRRQEIADCEKRYLDAKRKFVQAMAFGPNHYHHEKARTWALNRGIAAMKALDQSKADLRLLDTQLLILRDLWEAEKAKIERRQEWQQAAEQQQQQSRAGFLTVI